MKGQLVKNTAACLMAALCVTSMGVNPVSASGLNQEFKVAASDATAVESNKVVLYEHASYLGETVALGLGRYTSDDLGAVKGKLSADKVPEGYLVILYENSDFTGRKMVLTQDVEFLEDFNDITSSVVVSENKATLYKDAGYTGPSVKLGVGKYTYNDFMSIGNDALTCVKVPEGLKVTLYENSDFTGTQMVVTSDTDFYGTDFNDLTSAVEVSLDE